MGKGKKKAPQISGPTDVTRGDATSVIRESFETSGIDRSTLSPAELELLDGTPMLDAVANEASGREEKTDFGDYWVVPDETVECVGDAVGEQITETEFAAVQAAWTKITSGSGSIKISETGPDGDVSGFEKKILEQLGKLMSKPQGRALVMGLVNGGSTVTIKPAKAGSIASARRGDGSLENDDGTAGAGGTTTINIDPTLSDDKVSAFDKDGNEIPSPVWLILGHELIHAEHNAAGRNRRNQDASADAWGNKEEEETINSGAGVTENKLRAEHGEELGQRYGHGGKIN